LRVVIIRAIRGLPKHSIRPRSVTYRRRCGAQPSVAHPPGAVGGFRSLGGALRNPGSAVGEAKAVRAPPPSWITPGGLLVSGDGGVYRWIVVWLGRRWRHSPEGRAEDRGPRAEGALGADRWATCGCRPYIVGYRIGVAAA
jgi:hypothetical protein